MMQQGHKKTFFLCDKMEADLALLGSSSSRLSDMVAPFPALQLKGQLVDPWCSVCTAFPIYIYYRDHGSASH